MPLSAFSQFISQVLVLGFSHRHIAKVDWSRPVRFIFQVIPLIRAYVSDACCKLAIPFK